MCGLSPATAPSRQAYSGRLHAGVAGISVHCQVLSFIGGSGLSVGTYLVGKLLHGGLSALFIAVLVRLFPLEAPVSVTWPTGGWHCGHGFHRTLVISLVAPGCSSSFSSLWRPPQREKALARGIGACYNETL